MSNEYLSQEEVDALLRGVGDTGAAAETTETRDGIRPYDIATQERIVRGRMPALELINERFVRQLRVALFDFMHRSLEISIDLPRVVKYAEFVRDLAAPTSLNIVTLHPLRGNGLVVIDPGLIFGIVDNLFGGGRFPAPVEEREFTATEQGIIRRLLEVVLDEYRKAWAPVFPLQPEFLRSETHAPFATIAMPIEIVVESAIKIQLGSVSGKLRICVPFASVEPIRDVLFSGTRGDRAPPDARWMTMLAREVQDADVELVVNLSSVEIHVRDLVSLKPGDVVPIDVPGNVLASIDGVPMFDCKFGTLNGQYAVKVDRILTLPRDEFAQGERHVQ